MNYDINNAFLQWLLCQTLKLKDLLSKNKQKDVPHYIKDDIWEWILSKLSSVKGLHTKDTENLRIFIEAIFFVLRTGCQWRMLPDYYGDWRAIHKRFHEWSKKGIWHDLFKAAQTDVDDELYSIDASVIRAHACAAGYKESSNEHEGLGRSVGGFSTKLHILVDGLGNPIDIDITPGQEHDSCQSRELTKNLKDTNVLGDKGYDDHEFVEDLEGRNCKAIIPNRKNRVNNVRVYNDGDKHLYKERSFVEICIGFFKHYRRVFSRFDKTKMNYKSLVCFAGMLIWLR